GPPPRRPASDLRRPWIRAVHRAHPDGDQRDGGQHQRHRILRAERAAHVRDPRDVVRHHPARPARLLAQRPAGAGRTPDPALAPRLSLAPAGGPRGGTLMLTVEAPTKTYGDMVAISRIDFTAEAGELVCIVGPSGSRRPAPPQCVPGPL